MKTTNNVRMQVWNALREVALPDSRFHFDFSEFIPDFIGSDSAIAQLIEMDVYKDSKVVFITPDNCLEKLRSQVIRDKKVMLMTTYGIRRGFIELLPDLVPDGLDNYAILLDVIEKIGHYISLKEIQQRYLVDLMVTGGSAVTRSGIRAGKGHGFFDIEWATLYSLGVVNTSTPIVDIVHDCQVVDEGFEINPFDTICDFVITPTQIIRIPFPQKPTGGIYWDKLEPGMMDRISILKELQRLFEEGKLQKGIRQLDCIS
jgi:5-formyltetrahydrofolate cyclo-ligase